MEHSTTLDWSAMSCNMHPLNCPDCCRRSSRTPFKPDFLLVRQNLRDAGEDYRYSTTGQVQVQHSWNCTGTAQLDMYRHSTTGHVQVQHSWTCTGTAHLDMYRYSTTEHVQVQHSWTCTGTAQLDMHRYSTTEHIQVQHNWTCTGTAQLVMCRYSTTGHVQVQHNWTCTCTGTENIHVRDGSGSGSGTGTDYHHHLVAVSDLDGHTWTAETQQFLHTVWAESHTFSFKKVWAFTQLQ